MLPYRESWITRVVLGLFFLLVIVYAYFEARGLLFGPTITFSPFPSATTTPYILIQGQATHIDALSADGAPIPITETGAFQEPYVLAPGANRIVFDAKDPYGNKTEKVIQIVYTPPATTSLPLQAASSTATTTAL